MVPAVVATDEKARPLRPAILQNDARAVAELAELATRDRPSRPRVADRLTAEPTVGGADAALVGAPRAEPLAGHGDVLGSYDWLLVALGAEPHVELNWAIESGLYDLCGGQLAEVVALCACARAPAAGRPQPGRWSARSRPTRPRRPGCGRAHRSWSAAPTTCSPSPAAGLHEPGDLLIKLGGAGDIMLLTDRVVTDRRLYLDSYPVPGRWMPNGCMATSGSLLRWVQALVGGTDLGLLDAEAETCPAGEVLCLPYFLGEKTPLHDPDLRGAFVGLHLGHGRGCVASRGPRGDGVRLPPPPRRLRRARLHRAARVGHQRGQPLDDVEADRRRRDRSTARAVLDHPGASLGAALAAGIALGEIDGWAAAFETVRYGEPIEFDPQPARPVQRPLPPLA